MKRTFGYTLLVAAFIAGLLIALSGDAVYVAFAGDGGTTPQLLQVPTDAERASMHPVGTPTVDGLFSGDENNYFLLGAADNGRGTLYFNRVGNTLYLLMRVDPSVNDNVFGKPG